MHEWIEPQSVSTVTMRKTSVFNHSLRYILHSICRFIQTCFACIMSTFTTVQSHRRVKKPADTRSANNGPSCKHCENLKLPFDHWLRDKDGTTVCPVLLDTECRYCHEKGHTLSKCEKRALANQSREKPMFPSIPVNPAPVIRSSPVAKPTMTSTHLPAKINSQMAMAPPPGFHSSSKKSFLENKRSFSLFLSSSESDSDEDNTKHADEVDREWLATSTIVIPTLPKLSLIHPDDCESYNHRSYSPIHFSCLDRYPAGTPWTEMDYSDEEEEVSIGKHIQTGQSAYVM